MYRFKYEDLFNVKKIKMRKVQMFMITSLVGNQTEVINRYFSKKKFFVCAVLLNRNSQKVKEQWTDFKCKNSDWLKREITLFDDAITSTSFGHSILSSSSGRPSLSYTEKSDRAKRLESTELL